MKTELAVIFTVWLLTSPMFGDEVTMTDTQAHGRPFFDGSFALANNDATASGGGTSTVIPASDDQTSDEADLAKKLQNPVAASSACRSRTTGISASARRTR